MIRPFVFTFLALLLGIASISHAEDFKKTTTPDALKKFLPIAPEGWKVINVSSQNDVLSKAPVTTSQCRYVQSEAKSADPDVRVDLQINDWVNRPDALRRMIRIWALTNETDKDTGSYVRGTIVAGYPAQETYDKASSTHSLVIIVGGRYCINLDVYNRPETALLLWLDRIDLKTLATAQ